MLETYSRIRRVVIQFSDEGAIHRFSVKTRDADGKYVPIKRPWTQQDFGTLQNGRQVMDLVSRGVSDYADAIRIVNSRRRSRRQGPKKSPVAQRRRR
jgi:hypothetical protein